MPSEASAARTTHTPLSGECADMRDTFRGRSQRWSAFARIRAQSLTFATGDLLAFAAAALIAQRLYVRGNALPGPGAFAGLVSGHWATSGLLDMRLDGDAMRTALLVVIVLINFARREHYTVRVPKWTMLREIVGAIGAAMLCEEILLLISPYSQMSLSIPVLRWSIAAALLLLGRWASRRLLERFGFWRLDTVVVGPKSASDRIVDALSCEPALGYRVVGAVDAADRLVQAALLPRDALAGAATALRRVLAAHGGNFLMIAVGFGESETPARLMRAAQEAGVPFAVVPVDRLAPALGRQSQYFLSHDVAVITFHPRLSRYVARKLKFCFDIAGAASLLVLSAPLMLAIAWQIRRDGGPALFYHRRIGANGHSFPCMKFRTMHANADALLANILDRDPVAASEWAASQKLKDDPRITAIGHVLRRTSLDELPQLINVLRGEMSLVGPRPIVASEARFYGRHIADYCAARPGITGLWQVSGRSDTSYPRRVQLDVWYVRNWILWHDVAILLKTVPAVLFRRGAV